MSPLPINLIVQENVNRPKLYNHFISILKKKTLTKDYFTIDISPVLYFHIHLSSNSITIISKKSSLQNSKTFLVNDSVDIFQKISEIILSNYFEDSIRYVFIDQELDICTVFENTLKNFIQSKLNPNMCIKFFSYNRYFDLTPNDIRYYDRQCIDRIYSIDCTSLLIKLKTRCASTTKNKILRMSNRSIYIIRYDEIDPRIILDCVLNEIKYVHNESYEDKNNVHNDLYEDKNNVHNELYEDKNNVHNELYEDNKLYKDFLIKYTNIPLQLFLRDKYAIWYDKESVFKRNILEYYSIKEKDVLYFFCRDKWDIIGKYYDPINSLVIYQHGDVIGVNDYIITSNDKISHNKLISRLDFDKLIFNLNNINEDNLSTKHYILEILKGSSLLEKAITNLLNRTSEFNTLFTMVLYICELVKSKKPEDFEDSLLIKIKNKLYDHKYNKLLIMIIYIEVNDMWKNNENYEFFRDIQMINKRNEYNENDKRNEWNKNDKRNEYNKNDKRNEWNKNDKRNEYNENDREYSIKNENDKRKDLVDIIKKYYDIMYKKINFVNFYNRMIEESFPNIIKEYEENK